MHQEIPDGPEGCDHLLPTTIQLFFYGIFKFYRILPQYFEIVVSGKYKTPTIYIQFFCGRNTNAMRRGEIEFK